MRLRISPICKFYGALFTVAIAPSSPQVRKKRANFLSLSLSFFLSSTRSVRTQESGTLRRPFVIAPAKAPRRTCAPSTPLAPPPPMLRGRVIIARHESQVTLDAVIRMPFPVVLNGLAAPRQLKTRRRFPTLLCPRKFLPAATSFFLARERDHRQLININRLFF